MYINSFTGYAFLYVFTLRSIYNRNFYQLLKVYVYAYNMLTVLDSHLFGFSLGGSSGPGRPTSHRTKSHRTKDYFKKLDEDFVGDYNNKKGSKSKVNGMDNLPRHQHDVSSSENDDEIGGLESWDEDESVSRSEDESESASESEVASEHESEQKSGLKRRGWYGHEDDLFKDTDSD